MIKKFEENKLGRDFVIGDLHGCYNLLFEGLSKLDFDKEIDRVFSVGDLIDRGPNSEKCLSLLYEPWFHTVKGNHEEILQIIVDEGGDWDWWCENGGEWSKDVTVDNLREYARIIKSLPIAISVGSGETRFNVIHAEFYGTDEELDKGEFDHRTIQTMLWSRSGWYNIGTPLNLPGLSPTFCGHTILSTITKNGSLIGIDCGAYKQERGSLAIIQPVGQSILINETRTYEFYYSCR